MSFQDLGPDAAPSHLVTQTRTHTETCPPHTHTHTVTPTLGANKPLSGFRLEVWHLACHARNFQASSYTGCFKTQVQILFLSSPGWGSGLLTPAPSSDKLLPVCKLRRLTCSVLLLRDCKDRSPHHLSQSFCLPGSTQAHLPEPVGGKVYTSHLAKSKPTGFLWLTASF